MFYIWPVLPYPIFPAPGSYLDDVGVQCSTPGNVCYTDGFEGLYMGMGGADMTVKAVPEPSLVELLIAGLACLAMGYGGCGWYKRTILSPL